MRNNKFWFQKIKKGKKTLIASFFKTEKCERTMREQPVKYKKQ